MSTSYIPTREAELKAFATVYAGQCEVHQAELGLTAPQLVEIETAANEFANEWDAAEALKNDAAAQITVKNNAKAQLESVLRTFSQLFMNDPDVSTTTLGDLGLPTSPSTSGPLTAPAMLTATPFADGVNKLSWKRNGNAMSTIFTIEAKYGTSSTWTFVDSTQATKFTHSGQTVGLQVTYRVVAKRAGETSAPSNEAVVYSGGMGGGETFVLIENLAA